MADHIFELYCNICGKTSKPSRGRENTPNDYLCVHCKSSIRYRSQAKAIMSVYGQGRFLSLSDAIKSPDFKKLKILEVAIKGSLVRVLSKSPNYQQAYFWDNVQPGNARQGIRCEDLQSLTYPDGSFDLVITTEVMEHVADPTKAFREIHRVLRPGGSYIFTIPVRVPMRPQTKTRAIENSDGEVQHVEPPHYHISGIGDPSLVYTDFGFSLFSELRKQGFLPLFIQSDTWSKQTSKFGTFCAIRI